MKTVNDLTSENYLLRVRIETLEKELELKDVLHLEELKLINKGIFDLMTKYKLN